MREHEQIVELEPAGAPAFVREPAHERLRPSGQGCEHGPALRVQDRGPPVLRFLERRLDVVDPAVPVALLTESERELLRIPLVEPLEHVEPVARVTERVAEADDVVEVPGQLVVVVAADVAQRERVVERGDDG